MRLAADVPDHSKSAKAMKLLPDQLRLSATDVSNHLACRHLTTLELSVEKGERKPPDWRAPDLKIIQQLGIEHETRYLNHLAAQDLQILNLDKAGSENSIAEATLAAMRHGIDVVAQGALQHGCWFGRPDVLRKVEKPSPAFGNYSYEAHDCKLARETKATTILQLSFYSELLTEIQGVEPDEMRVIAPGTSFKGEPYRVAEYAAYYRYVKDRLEKATSNGDGPSSASTYPEPCAHCDICRWFQECGKRRRDDDHLSLVAGIRAQQRTQLEIWNRNTVASLAEMPFPLKEKPLHGSRESMERVREQARVQVAGRRQEKLVHELLKFEPDTGFYKLPEPNASDMFVDLEGDPFAGNIEAGGGQEYLFGFVAQDASGARTYYKQWALNPEEEKRGFEWLVDEVMQRWKQNPAMHIYHFGAYEPGAFKRLMGRYATREEEVDSMLRAGLFVDIHIVLKQAMLASVEQYSLKKLEALPNYVRKTSLVDSREAMYFVEHKLQLGRDLDLPDKYREIMEGYNGEDCLATVELRDWLETQRAAAIAAGANIYRPPLGDPAPTEELDEKQRRVAALVEKLKTGIPLKPEERTREQSAVWMLANLLDWHRRENKAAWWEGYRLQELDDNELLDERAGLAGLKFVERLAIDKKIPTDRYAFDKQDTEVRIDKDVYVRVSSAEAAAAEKEAASKPSKENGKEKKKERGKDKEKRRQKFGCVVAMDLATRTIDIKKTKKTAEQHPNAVWAWDAPMSSDAHADALRRLGDWVAEYGIDAPGSLRAARDLLLRKMPQLARGESLTLLPLEEPVVTARRIATALDHSVFAIQGPPGAGKTYTGARMICKLVSQGKKVGITALSHKVIRKLLEEVVGAASEDKIRGVKCMQKLNEADDLEPDDHITIATDNDLPLASLQSGAANVVGATSWMWTRPEYLECVDALFIDEAGQMALADVAALGQAGTNMFLIGDPQQLERPVKGSHPDGAEKSALEHLIGDHKTIPEGLGMLLPETWRMHPKICDFTSELFYEGRLQSRDILKNRVLAGHPWLSGAGLWFVPIQHEGNRNSAAEEVEVIAKIVKGLIGGDVCWFRGIDRPKTVDLDDVLIVAPYNAQVSDLLNTLPKGARVGTVDKFQGQEAAVVIYSLTTSSPEDAPRGMEFLYGLNRFNVATSRAMSNVIVVGSPRLFEPECRSPRQIQLANALCRYLEMATVVDPSTLKLGPGCSI
jgi:predicted RecB family nuclease